jgi:hypothetical protein
MASRMHGRTRLRLLVLVTALAACGEARPSGDPAPAADAPALPAASTDAPAPPADMDALLAAQGYRSLPMRSLATGHFAVDGVADGTPFALIVDTGASHTIVDRQRARRFRLVVTEQRGEATGLGGGGHRVATGVLRDVAMGPLRIDSLPVSVLDLGHINQTLRAQRAGVVDGILGADLLVRKRAIIDYGARRLYLLPDGRQRPAGSASH